MAILGPPITRDHIPHLLTAYLRRAYLDQESKMPKMYPKLYNVLSSKQATELDVVMGGLGTYVRKPEGAPITFDAIQELYTVEYRHGSWDLGVQFTIEVLQDDIHGVLRRVSSIGGSLAQVANYTAEVNAMDLFNSNLTSGTVYTAGGTAYPLLSTTHYRADGGTWSNMFATPLDLSIESLEAMITHWSTNQVNSRGQLLFTDPSRLIVGPSDGPLAMRLVRSMKRPQSGDNDVNVVRDWFGEPLVMRLMTDDGRWLVAGDKDETGLNYFERYRPNIMKLPDGDNLNLRLCGFYRESHGASKPAGIAGSA